MLCSITECSVSELTRVLGLSQPRISQHLKQCCAAGLLEKFRDGHFVFYRVPTMASNSSAQRRLLAMLPDDEPQFAQDIERLRQLRADDQMASSAARVGDRSLHRALVELTVVRPLGELLDIGCGQGRILKLLASRTRRAVGVDIDSDARRLARAELLLAGTPNTTLRHGDMYALPFDDQDFDTVLLDDVLTTAADPLAVLREAQRLLRPGGRLLLLVSVGNADVEQLRGDLARWAAAAKLRLAPPRAIPSKHPGWLLAVAS